MTLFTRTAVVICTSTVLTTVSSSNSQEWVTWRIGDGKATPFSVVLPKDWKSEDSPKFGISRTCTFRDAYKGNLTVAWLPEVDSATIKELLAEVPTNIHKSKGGKTSSLTIRIVKHGAWKGTVFRSSIHRKSIADGETYNISLTDGRAYKVVGYETPQVPMRLNEAELWKIINSMKPI